MRRLRWLFRRGRKERELREELEFHLDTEARDRESAGLPTGDARIAARRELGNFSKTMDAAREAWGWSWIGSFAQDLRFGLRALAKSPGFSAVAVTVMALGIGANTAMFSVVDAVLLKPLDYPDPEALVRLSTFRKGNAPVGTSSAPDFHDWRSQNRTFDSMAYYATGSTAVVVHSDAAYAEAAAVSSDFFRVFRVAPAAGRLFDESETKPGSSGAAVVSHSFFQKRLGGSTAAIGQQVRMLGVSLTIVGVLAPGFAFPSETEVWIPINTFIPDSTSRSSHNYQVIGRLKTGVSLDQAQAEMTAIAGRLEKQYPDSNAEKAVAVARLRDLMVRDVRLTLYLLLGAVGVVLLIACANMANLLLARATVRVREIAIRAALGAGRLRIVRQLITESVALALAAGAAGVALAHWGSQALVALAPAGIPRLADSGIDVRVLAFTFAVSLAASVLFGLAPALQISRVDFHEALTLSASRSVAGGRAGRLRSALVVAEVAFSVVLLAGAGLLVRSFVALNSVALGFRTDNILVMSSSVPAAGDESARAATRFYKELLREVAAMPGVSAAGAARSLPGNVASNGRYWIDYLPPKGSPNDPKTSAVLSVVAPGTFEAMGIPLRHGRDFRDSDAYDAPFTAIINESLAKKSFPGQDPIGRLIFCGLDTLKPMRIVGVVGDIRQWGPASEPTPELFMAYEQHPRPSTALTLVVRTDAGAGSLPEAIRRKARELSSDVPVKFSTMESTLAETVAAPRFRTLLLSLFAGLAVCLAMAGVYAVMAYVVGQRSSEIGVRMALGAGAADVLGLVLRQGLAYAGAGVAIGLAGALAATRLLEKLLFGVRPNDPATYAGVAILAAAVTLAACIVPARRASRVDPLTALRQE